METKRRPKIVVWFVSNDRRFINNAVNILIRQHNGVEILGVTATQKIVVNNLKFIPLNEISMNGGGGMTSSLLPAQDNSVCHKL